MNPIDGFTVTAADLRYIGEGLQRPECILAERDGSLWSADARGGVVHIRPDGRQHLIAQALDTRFGATQDEAERFTSGTLPNGLAFDADGSILIANFGTDRLERMTRSGQTKVMLEQVAGQPVGKVNFVLRDGKGRIWITVSTRIANWMDAISPKVADGYVAVLDGQGARIVADGFAFTNEIRFDAAEEWLYVVETAGRRITRLRIGEGARVEAREVFGPSDTGGLIDGIAFDAYGNLWATHVMTDRVFALTPQGEMRIILDDTDPVKTAELNAAFEADTITPELLLSHGGTIAPWFASVTFGGPDLRNVYIGSLRGNRIPMFRSPVAGLPMAHWNDAW